MKVAQTQFSASGAYPAEQLAPLQAIKPQLVIVFGSVAYFRDPQFCAALTAAFPQAQRIGCSTSGEIAQQSVFDDSAVVTAVALDDPALRVVSVALPEMDRSRAVGQQLGESLRGDGLHTVLVLSHGVGVNGSDLIAGFADRLDASVKLAGGLAGDGGAFATSYVLHNEQVAEKNVVAVGLYSPRLRVSHGSFGGWKPFGAVRRITRSEGNVLFELDNEPALQIYKRYLGDHAKDLPGSGLLFPLALLDGKRQETNLIRTILGVDEEADSLILAGDMPQGNYVQLMYASTDELIKGAQSAADAAAGTAASAAASAAQHSFTEGVDQQSALAMLVSCVGRKLVMGGRVDEEVAAVAGVFGQNCTLTGFYSNGEISPFFDAPECKLHNQTMTITYIRES